MWRSLLLGFQLVAAPLLVDHGYGNDPQPAIDYGSQIQPILRRSCYSCHGREQQESGLRLDVRARAFAGGDGGRIIIPGDSGSSRLMDILAGRDESVGRMPPEGVGTPLSPRELSLLNRWISQGAKWPAKVGEAERSDHWSFQPLSTGVIPTVRNAAWLRNPIDAFVLADMESHDLAPSRAADRPTLIRRLSLDLLGLPPTPEQVEAFVSDTRPNAYERLVSQFLASPHFGERWGRHWLDLARYADSDGYEKDRPRPHAWRYRNWVIDQLNADLPYDQFTIAQIAGDLLPGESAEPRVATGFHRNTLHNTEGGVDREEDRVKKTVDRTNTVGTIWLGLTVGCAQCHSHKYDPLSQREYFSLFAFFDNMEEVSIEAPLAIDRERLAAQRFSYEKEHQRLLNELAAYEREPLLSNQASWELTAVSAVSGSAAGQGGGSLPSEIVEALSASRADRSPKQLETLARFYRGIDPKLIELKERLEKHAASAPPRVMARAVAEQQKSRITRVHLRGDFLNPGESVEPAIPRVLVPLGEREARPSRLDFAHWLVDSNNPLPPRVTVNRIWARLLGRGIVATLDDFGTQGELPSHPDLLDWLASAFMRGNWSVKELIRTIVCSATYRQSSAARPELAALDPENVLLARQNRRRADAEVIRDMALAVSGLLDTRVGGPSVRPPQPTEYSRLTYADSAKWEVSSGGDAYRRGLYTFFQRTSPYPMLMTFDSPDSTECCVDRSRSNTPLQALTLWNDPVFFECARAFGRRVARRMEGTDSSRARQLAAYSIRLAISREPDRQEVEDLLALYHFQRSKALDEPRAARALVGGTAATDPMILSDQAAWTVVGRTLLNLDEFLTRE